MDAPDSARRVRRWQAGESPRREFVGPNSPRVWYSLRLTSRAAWRAESEGGPRAAMALKYFVETYGCQMNEYDSAFIETVLGQHGWEPADSMPDTDLLLLNTCAIRDKAETRIIGRIGELMPLKERKPVVFAVAGCMAQRMGRDLMRKSPAVDIVLGPDTYHRLPEHVNALRDFGTRVVDVSVNDDPAYYPRIEGREGSLKGFVTATIGCDKKCTYCIVPMTRGVERPKALGHILGEVQSLVTNGTREITLLGQNVNSYHWQDIDFAALLRHVAQVPGLWRVRFTTSHPIDMNARIIEALRDEPTLMEYLHLPVQAGSSRTLRRMSRHYTREEYLDTIAEVRRVLPDIALTTDIIVGFPGETDAEFEETLSLMEQVRYDAAYVFKYSMRPGTPAEKLEARDAVDGDVRQRRLEAVNALQARISREKNQALVGTTQEVLVEGLNKKDGRLLAKTRTNKTFLFPGDANALMGRLVEARVLDAQGLVLHGEFVRDVTPALAIPVTMLD